MIDKERKRQLMADYGKSESDSGSIELQIALLTERINQLNKHFESHKKDYGSRTGLMKLVGQRRRFLRYLERRNRKAYATIIERLELRA